MSEEYDPKVIEAVKDRYETRIKTILNTIKASLIEKGWRVVNADEQPYEMFDTEFSWWLSAYRPGRDDDDGMVDVRIEISEGRSYGDDDIPNGINFGLQAVEWGGRPLGGLQPFNFTKDVWVDAGDEEAVEARFMLIEEAYLDEFVHLMED